MDSRSEALRREIAATDNTKTRDAFLSRTFGREQEVKIADAQNTLRASAVIEDLKAKERATRAR